MPLKSNFEHQILYDMMSHVYQIQANPPPYHLPNSSLSGSSSRSNILNTKIAIDRSPIAPLSNLEIGSALSMTYSSVTNPPLPMKPFIRAMKCRAEAALADIPLVISQLAQSGPDSDFTMSIESLTALATAVRFNTPLAIFYYNINNRFYFDEPLHHESHPWSSLFVQGGLPIDRSSAENISLLNTIALCAFDKEKSLVKQQWFSSLKGDVVFSERSQQRWFRDTENFLPHISEDFSRSFNFGISDLSLHVGTNSVLCQTEDSDEPAIIRYCKKDPTDMQICQWALESTLGACDKILLTSSEAMKLTRFEKINAPRADPELFYSLFDFLRFIKNNSNEEGCYMLHKRENSDTILLRKVTNEELEMAKLIESYQMRVSLIEMITGFRHTLSTNMKTVENGRNLLFRAIEYCSPKDATLCFERIADSLILPVLLLNRTTSLIVATEASVESIELSHFHDALNCYEQALQFENLPEQIITSLHHKIATTLFARAVLTNDDKSAAASLKVEEITHEFKLKVAIWRCENAMKATNQNENEKAVYLAHMAISLCENDEEKIEPKRLLANAINVEAQSYVAMHRYTRASERFNAALKIFEEIGDLTNLAATEANLAHIERCLADSLSMEKHGEYTQEEDRRLMSAAKYYLTAISRVKTDSTSAIHDELCLNLASLYRSVVIRYTQSPPIKRMKAHQIEEEVTRCIKEANNLLNNLGEKTSEVQRQIAALNTWHAKFILEFQMKYCSTSSSNSAGSNNTSVEDDEKKQKLALQAKNLFSKARQFFIADNYPADYVNITLSMASLKLVTGQPLEAMRTLMECLRALRPTSIVLRHKNIPQQQTMMQSQSRNMLNQMLPSVLEVTRNILKEMLFDKMKRKQPCDFEKGLYRTSLEAKEENVVNLLQDLKKSLKM
ncbi:hypothetical protein TRFO_33544 [Tritrichomonas foetus]|uniref:Clu domain-containing protein n=1 Tax=Tritrichomonas foetus TaxID=1144522 RepID=A0A1J4JML3_9EUKA|nr:hypothetical protein TRFO_33544 [Tritrichomonas foetus]|eukprot:OHS99937.1 hypothetical protein TRFO_33544 [Tritrichomonas foetus]